MKRVINLTLIGLIVEASIIFIKKTDYETSMTKFGHKPAYRRQASIIKIMGVPCLPSGRHLIHLKTLKFNSMKKAILPIVILFLIACNSFAQVDYQINSALDLFNANKMATGDFSQTITEEDIDGSPYLNDEFINGTIYTTSKLQYVDIPLRYNIFNDDLEFRTNDQVMAMATPEIIERVTFGEYEMVYIPFASQKKMKRGYFKVVVSGDISFYARPQILFQQPEEPGAYKEAKPAKFVSKSDTYYLRNGKDEAIKVDKKSEVIDFFPSHNDEIATYIKKNKIKTNKKDALKKLVEYYNSNF